jgi:histidinol-phosphate aminotransferase
MDGSKVRIADLVRRDVMEMEAYHPSAPSVANKLDSNESPFQLPSAIRTKLINWLENRENLNRYPESDNTALRTAIAGFWGQTPGNVTCGVGSDQLIDIICRVFLEPGDRIVTLSPTFGMYAVSAALNHGRAVAVTVKDGENAASVLVSTADAENAKIIFLCSPNNPTGLSLSEADLRFVAENARCLVVIDEAYGEFSESTMIGAVNEYPNMIVLRTFSKAYGLAGVRVGYAIASSEVIDILDIAKPPFNIPTISQLLAEWAIEEAAEYGVRARDTVALREELYRELKKISWLDVNPSDSNFLYVRSEYDVASMLEDCGIAVRRLPKDGNLYCSRITVGVREENKKVSDRLCRAKPK